jgi:hypothetical protein
MRARKVKGLDPDGPLAENLCRIVTTRLEELHSFSPKVLDPRKVRALHDMRIAAKRLRYVLEISEPVLGPAAKSGVKAAKGLQDLLGEIHDCDEMLPLVERHVARLRAEDAVAALAAADRDAEDLDPSLVVSGANGALYRGLSSLAVYLQARRDLLYTRFVEEWARLAETGFREELEAAVQSAAAKVG